MEFRSMIDKHSDQILKAVQFTIPHCAWKEVTEFW